MKPLSFNHLHVAMGVVCSITCETCPDKNLVNPSAKHMESAFWLCRSVHHFNATTTFIGCTCRPPAGTCLLPYWQTLLRIQCPVVVTTTESLRRVPAGATLGLGTCCTLKRSHPCCPTWLPSLTPTAGGLTQPLSV